jgi:hypothetical protein
MRYLYIVSFYGAIDLHKKLLISTFGQRWYKEITFAVSHPDVGGQKIWFGDAYRAVDAYYWIFRADPVQFPNANELAGATWMSSINFIK